MRSILVQGGRDTGMAARLDTAMDLARIHNAHLTLAIDTPIGQFVTVDPYGGSYVAREALDAALAADDALAAAFAGRLANDDVPFDVMQFETLPLEAMISAAKLADLAVISRDCGYAGDLAVAARCPVLVLWPDQPLALPLSTACIAWDGSDQAAMALRGCVALLDEGTDVHLLTVLTDAPQAFPATEALHYLARHGIKAELHELAKAASIEETLLTEVTRLGGQVLVMGAFGHSRLREFMFGGVTRYFLDEASAPALLMAH
ncbi:universal stress protein [Novosphingobium sp.]|uniref:universal stress protein n=1 Tax=Novosphingobium sp. TaxID=1874826 RepID=UPI00286C529F|nr:universal stress protein [Novosphingobium sp.]